MGKEINFLKEYNGKLLNIIKLTGGYMYIKQIKNNIKFLQTRLKRFKDKVYFDSCNDCGSDETTHEEHNIFACEDFTLIETFLIKEMELLQQDIKDIRMNKLLNKRNKIIKKLSKFKWVNG